MEKPAGKIVIYQMMTRLFGNTKTTNKPYGTIGENGVGKFNDINDAALSSLKQMGITHVWYTGVIEHALLTDYTKFGIPLDDADVVKGRAGSPYAIKDYYDVNPDLAVDVPNRMKEFESLVERTHNQGMKVIIDFVPNHVARAYHSDTKPEGIKDLGETDNKTVAFAANNNFYYLPGQPFQVPHGYDALGGQPFPTKDGKFDETPAKATGNDKFTAAPDINDWFETVKLNYGVDIQNNYQTHFDPVPNTWTKMRDILLFWAQKNIDGFRCDMAEMVPAEFWSWVIPQVKDVNNNIVFIAEIYNPDLYHTYINKGKFDYLYDKVLLYDTLRMLINGHRESKDVAAVQERLSDITDHMLHFLENHDEQRIASPQFAGDPWKAVPAFVISATIDKGPIMIYFGQEVGEPGAGHEGFQGDDGRTTIFDYWGVPVHQKWVNNGAYDGGQLTDVQKQLRWFYKEIVDITQTSAITEGDYHDMTRFNVDAGNFDKEVHAFIRNKDKDILLMVNSFNKENKTVKVQIPAEVAKAIGLDAGKPYIYHDMMWREIEGGLDDTFSFSLLLKPYSSFVFKIK